MGPRLFAGFFYLGKMKQYLLIIFLNLTTFNALAELQAPIENSCSFYLSLEQSIPCGPSGYTLDFGYPYCEKFLKSNFYRFSRRGKKFLIKNSFCLQEEIYKNYSENDNLTCKKLKNIAFSGHADCYIDSGFCDLSLFDKIILTNVIKKQIPLKRVRAQMKEVLARCHN